MPTAPNHPLSRWRSSFLQERHLNLQRVLRADLLLWFPELRGAPRHVVEALDLATSFEAWDRLRADRELAATSARAVVEGTIVALLRDHLRKPARRSVRR